MGGKRLPQLWHSLQVGVRGYTLLLLLLAKVALEVNSIALFGNILSIYGFYLEAHKKNGTVLKLYQKNRPTMLFSQMDSFRHHTNVLFPLGMDVEGYNDMNLFIITISFLHRENLLALKVSGCRLGQVNLHHRAR